MPSLPLPITTLSISLSARYGASAQVTLAWVIGSDEHVHTIPGTTKLEFFKSHLGSYDIVVAADEVAALDALADCVHGERYDEGGMAAISG